MPAAELPEHPVHQDAARLLASCVVRRQRRSGPGGQHRNKVSSGIFLRHQPTGVTSEATERRSQQDNLRRALFRLRVNLAIQCRTAAERDSPSALWQQRCRGGRLQVSASHDDFPRLLAEALDQLARTGWDARLAAERLGCTRSQLIKLLKLEPRALQALNRQRQTQGLSPLTS